MEIERSIKMESAVTQTDREKGFEIKLCKLFKKDKEIYLSE